MRRWQGKVERERYRLPQKQKKVLAWMVCRQPQQRVWQVTCTLCSRCKCHSREMGKWGCQWPTWQG
jgi:hypothetical protein